MKIKELSLDNRPREKMLKNGAISLSNEELLAILLGSGKKGSSAIELAYTIINDVGNLKALFSLDLNELLKINGIGLAKASIILASLELSKRALCSSFDKEVYDTPEKAFALLNPLLSLENIEVLYVLFLDNRCNLIKYKKMSIGQRNKCLFPIDSILNLAIRLEASNIIIAHNHPSGDNNPSPSDLEATKKLYEALEIININLIDHLIIGNNSYYSFSNMHIL
ncbi:MAG: DNA repair protein RadC [Anaeroplasmataceae bacterium]